MTKNIIATFIIVLMAIIGYFYTPKSRSAFGYKTPMSLKNDKTWNYANSIAKKSFLLVAIFFIIAEILFYKYVDDDYKAYSYSFQTLFVLSILVIPVVEISLILKFDKNGEPKTKN